MDGRRRSTLGRKRSDRDVVLEESPALPGGLLNAAYRSNEAAKMNTFRPAPSRHRPPSSANASRWCKIIGAVLALGGIALLIPTARDLFTGGGPKDLIGVLARLIPGPALVIGGLVLFEKGRLMEPQLFADLDFDDGDRARSIDAILGANRAAHARPAAPDASSADTDYSVHSSVSVQSPPTHDRVGVSESAATSTAAQGWPATSEPVSWAGDSAALPPTSAAGYAAEPARVPSVPDQIAAVLSPQANTATARSQPPRIVPKIAPTQRPDAAPQPPTPPQPGNGLSHNPPPPPPPTAPLAPGAEVARQVRASMNAADVNLIETYRHWVLGQALGAQTFQPLTVNDRYDEWFLLSASGVATLLAWTHEDHHATYSAETWVDQILPTQGIAISDRQLAIDLLRAAALHAGGLHTTPTERLTAYHPSELVTAMATVHVGLLRLYSGLEGATPAKILRDQLGDSPAPSLSTSSNDERRWLPPGS